MPMTDSCITSFLAFADCALEAATHYVSIFPRSKIVRVTRYPAGGPLPEGTVMTVSFELDGRRYVALNGGAHFSFTDGVSLAISCETQDEVDRYTERLVEGGGEEGPCGWVRDRFGLWWQVDPRVLLDAIESADPAAARRAFQAMMTMNRIDVRGIEAAVRG